MLSSSSFSWSSQSVETPSSSSSSSSSAPTSSGGVVLPPAPPQISWPPMLWSGAGGAREGAHHHHVHASTAPSPVGMFPSGSGNGPILPNPGSSGPPESAMSSRPANHILLFSIYNPRHPINSDVLAKVCSGLAYVLRVVILRKKRMDCVQAMLEFGSVQDALRIKEHLQGQDIYDNCCTMSIDFAYERVYKLKVHKNDEDSWDFTAAAQQPGGILKRPRPGLDWDRDFQRASRPSRNWSDYEHHSRMPMGYETSDGRPMRKMMKVGSPDHRRRRNEGFGMIRGFSAGQYSIGRDVNAITGPVTMAYELNMSKITPERLFNLLCLYGDVMRVKFLTTKEGCAMIEMSSPGSVAKVIQNLSGVELFGKEVVFRTCRQMEVVGGGRDVSRDIKTMANGSRVFEDFSACKNNRFRTPSMASKNRIIPPCHILHFFNLPPELNTAEQIELTFTELGSVKPKSIKIFAKDSNNHSNSSSNSSDSNNSTASRGYSGATVSGLAEFGTNAEAIDAIALCNHAIVSAPANPDKLFTLKLCFSVNNKMKENL